MDEKKVNQTLANASGDAAGMTTTTTTTTQAVPAYQDPQRVDAINRMYDANMNAQRSALEERGAQAVSEAQANRDLIEQNYQNQRNIAAVDWERQRRNFLEGANMNGINTGAGSQAQLAMMGQQQRTQNALGMAQAQAETDADRNIADIRRSTQAAINDAVAKNDYQRAAALLDEYNQGYNRTMKRAEALAQYGDFSGYRDIYGDEAAANMRNVWLNQNPDLAYRMGQLTQGQYNNLKAGLPMNYGLDANGNYAVGSRPANNAADQFGYGGAYYNYNTTPAPSPAATGSYSSGELLEAASGPVGATTAEIIEALRARGVDTSNPAVQADIAWARSK